MIEKLHQAARAYDMSRETQLAVEATPFHMLSSVSGGGKGVIADALVANGRYEYFVTHTTRQPRLGDGREEKDGEDYYFVSSDAMLELIERGVFIEVKIIHDKHVYGASVQELQRIREGGAFPLHTPDVSGAQTILDFSESALAIFIVPPSADEWIERLLGRGPISEAALKERIDAAIKEISAVLDDRRFIGVINDEIEEAVQVVDEIFHDKEVAKNYDKEARNTLKGIFNNIQKSTFTDKWRKKVQSS